MRDLLVGGKRVRIAIIGPQGSGKSTLANTLAKVIRFPLITEVARTAARVLKIPQDGMWLSPALGSLWQISIIYEQLASERRLNNAFVSDRSVIDNIAYLLLRHEKFLGYLHEDVITSCMQRCRENANNYTHIFYMPAAKGGLVNDGFRNTDPEYQAVVANKIWEVIKLWDLQGMVLSVPSDLSWEGKYAFVLQSLEGRA